MEDDKASGKAGGKANVVVGVVLALVVAVAVAAMVLMRFSAPGDANGLHVLVHDGDGVTHEIPLSEDSETTIATSLGMNVVTVRDGVVFVSEADCDNHDCIRQGGIGAPGKQIICLPHKLWIEVAADGGGSGRMDVGSVAAGEGEGDGGSDDGGGFDVVAR